MKVSHIRMTSIRAISLVRGIEEASSSEILEAWQYLYDSGAIYKLPSVYGRQMLALITAGRVRTKSNGTTRHDEMGGR